jgi:hypothetical protein
MKVADFLSKHIFISFTGTWLPLVYAFIEKSEPFLRFAGTAVGLTIGLLTLYGKILHIKKIKKQ